MTINTLAQVNVLVPYIIPFLTLLIVEAVVVIELWGVAGISGDVYVPIAWSTVRKERNRTRE
jgi:hypothetical protein